MVWIVVGYLISGAVSMLVMAALCGAAQQDRDREHRDEVDRWRLLAKGYMEERNSLRDRLNWALTQGEEVRISGNGGGV